IPARARTLSLQALSGLTHSSVIRRKGGGPMLIGESFIGEGAEAAHVNTVLGDRDGPVGTAWATALATPRQGHTAFIAVLRPGLPAKPLTLFVTKATVTDTEHSDLIWGAAQAGVAGGVADAVSEGVISAADADRLLLIAAVWVSPAAKHASTVYATTVAEPTQVLRIVTPGQQHVTDVKEGPEPTINAFYTARAP